MVVRLWRTPVWPTRRPRLHGRVALVELRATLAHLLHATAELLLQRCVLRSLQWRHERREVALFGFEEVEASPLNLDHALEHAIDLFRIRSLLVSQ